MAEELEREERPIEDEFEEEQERRGPGVTPLSIVREIVLNMSVLMFAAMVLIAFFVNFTQQALPEGYEKYTPLIIIPYIIIFGIVVAVFGGRLIAKLVLKPLNELIDATRKVADGDLDTRVHIYENKEMNSLARSFNRMTARLKRGRDTILKNLEEMRLLNEKLARTQHELLASEKLASVGRLAAGVAHEIGNPLSAISGYLEILHRRDYLREEDREMLERVQSEVSRMDEIINELLSYSRPSERKMEKFSLDETVDSALLLLSSHKGCELVEVRKELGQTPEIRANKSAVTQLVMNLALNAIQAMPKGGRLTISAREAEMDDKPGVKLVVEDTGPGIPADNKERVFDPFFTTKEPGRGTGLGLSICQRIVDDMKGRIEEIGKHGRGARFEVWLPEGADPGTRE